MTKEKSCAVSVFTFIILKSPPESRPDDPVGRGRSRAGLFICSTFTYFLLLYVLAAGDEPEIKMHNTDFSKRKKLKEGL